MTPKDMETAITYMMGKLSPEDLEELDGMIEGGTEQPVAQDARLTPNVRANWLSMGARARRAARSGWKARFAEDSATSATFATMFPDAGRLK